ncbi:MAG: ATPase P [Flavobacterium sp. BFFFF2]|nr:MAG: ATPase P [Flavobacterium sp. BFFFF2]
MSACQNKKSQVDTSKTVDSTEVALKDNPLNKLKYDHPTDLICHMEIKKFGVSDTLNFKGKLYGFCSSYCKDTFKKNPEKYLTKAVAKK